MPPVFLFVGELIAVQIGAWALGSVGLAFVSSVIALGLGIATARLLGLTGGSGGTSQDPGVRIQFPPSTTNKIPIVYGHANTKGIVTDARLSNENKTMTYVLTISEKTDFGGVFSVGNIYWNDQLLEFDATGGNQHKVVSSIDQNGNGVQNTNYNGFIRVRLYSGGTAAADQIFPPQASGNTASALTALGESDANYLMNDLVFAVVQVDYDTNNKGPNGLGQVTFEITNTLSNPAEVWWDYMTNTRYGVGIDGSQIDTTAAYALQATCDEIPPNQYTPVSYFPGSISGTVLTVTTSSTYPTITGTIAVGQRLFGGSVEDGTIITSLGSGSGGEGTYNLNISQTKSLDKLRGSTTSTQARYVINGVISTGDTVKSNIDKISIAGEAWTTFDYSQGKWKVISNRAATEGELEDAFVFTDDNIIGEVNINATNLEDLYNNLEIEFASRKIRDQNDYFKAEIDSTLRNNLEPDNKLSIRLEMANNALHAARIGLIELKQSRADLIISFMADYSALQVEAGDVVKITNEVYGFENKLFRVSKTREVEADEGNITVEITALQYDADVYTDEALEDSPDTPGSGIPSFGSSARLPAPSIPVVATINTTTPGFTISTVIDPASDVVDEVRWWYNTTSTGNFQPFASEPAGIDGFAAGSTVTDTVSLPVAGTFYFQAQTGKGGRYSDYSTSTSVGFVWNPNDYGGI